ncbi:hypothetical protein G3480_02985 [Thiorhodococcus mannitoliphagus]|uniref:Uncharacterized protein n=1 Tax=Thiorhodococcus mannitoliphagus TaxID=329406 RepID=A0A6P1DM06_9GAMM|nr:hypothetical protein [Thiorhodococcus mannitoliphagus]NEX19287.1 hypothetical protein [Thiorhodococcus mannitoliphagus]
MIDRRVPEAASLRLLFQEQGDLLRQLIANWQNTRLDEQAQRRALDEAVETIVSGTDARLRALSNYQQQLRQSTRELLVHIEDIVSRLPAPVLITKETLVMDQRIGPIFPDLTQVDRLIQERRVTRDKPFTDTAAQSTEIYALFSLFKHEKQGFGAELQGDIMVSDVLQTCVNFVGHQVIALEETETELRSTLKRTLFESIVSYIRQQTLSIRHARSAEEQRQDALDPSRNLKNPVVYLKTLKQLLELPRDLLAVQNHQLSINAMGVKVTSIQAEPTTSINSLDVNEISIGDSRPRILYMTRHPVAPAD